MEGNKPDGRSGRFARVMEKVLRLLQEHPFAMPSVAIAISLPTGIARHWSSPGEVLEILAACAAFGLWLPIWVSRRSRDPSGSSAITIIVAVVGSFITGTLLALDLAFAFVALALMAEYFTQLPFPVAVLCGFPPSFGSEYSHRLAVIADPTAFPWGLAIMRNAALVAIGISFKLLALQIEERTRLQSSLAAAERKAGMLEERQRLAREIHDTLAQGFAGIVVHLETAEQFDPLSDSPARPHLDLARSVAREGLDDARRMLAALRPEILAQRGLPEALARVTQEWSRRTGVAATLSITGAASPMHPDIELTILRAVQEALTNIARHAGARTVAVTLSYMEDVLVLDVQDDGKGFEPALTAGHGFGLAGMRERTERLEGSFSIESLPNEGTTVSITLPAWHPAGAETPAEGGVA